MNKILTYPCNLVGYVRLMLLITALTLLGIYDLMDWPLTSCSRWTIIGFLFAAAALDAIDGYLARKFGHVTVFGALLELMIDMLIHTTVWLISGLKIAPFILALEWSVALLLAALTYADDNHWKKMLAEKGPWLVRVYFKPMKVNYFCEYCNLAHFVLPALFFVYGSFNAAGWLMLPGLIIYELVTLMMLYLFFKLVLDNK